MYFQVFIIILFIIGLLCIYFSIIYKQLKLKIKQLKQLKFKQMKTKYLFQALKFACLPTLSVLTLLFFGFFDIAKTIEFISSDSPWAITLRVLLVIAEMFLIYVMYDHYESEGEKKDKRDNAGISENDNGTPIDYSKSIYDLKRDWKSSDKYNYYTKSEDIILIERTPAKQR